MYSDKIKKIFILVTVAHKPISQNLNRNFLANPMAEQGEVGDGTH